MKEILSSMFALDDPTARIYLIASAVIIPLVYWFGRKLDESASSDRKEGK